MRTYSESEVSAIIERAVERQHAVEAGVGEAGLTLDEIERIGREAGIDPSHLRAAAAEVDDVGRTLARQTGQTRTQVFVERWLDTPFATEGWEDAVAHLRTSFGAPMGAALGQTTGETVKQVGRSFEWAHTSALGVQTRVTVGPRGERTRLRITQLVGLSSPTVEGVAYGGVIAAVAGILALAAGSGLSGSPSLGALAGALTFLLAWAVAAPLVGTIDRRWRARKLSALGTLADDLTRTLQATHEQVSERSPDSVGGVSRDLRAGRLDLDALPDAPGETDPGRASRRRDRG